MAAASPAPTSLAPRMATRCWTGTRWRIAVRTASLAPPAAPKSSTAAISGDRHGTDVYRSGASRMDASSIAAVTRHAFTRSHA